MSLCGWGQDFNHHIRRTLAAVFIQFVTVAHHGQVRFNHRVNIFRGLDIPFKQADGERGRIHPALFPLKVIRKLPENLPTDFLMHS